MNKWQSLATLLQEGIGNVAPAVVCRVEQGNELIFELACGWLDPESPHERITTETFFDYASLTKLFTLTACLRLVQQRVLTLETPLVEILPEFGESRLLGGSEDPITKQPVPADPRWNSATGLHWLETSGITIRRLLTHTSGLPAWRSVYRTCGSVPSTSPIFRQAEQSQRYRSGLSAMMSYPLIYPPGKSYAYSDIGLILLGEALIRSSGAKNLSKLLSTLVLSPLQLTAHFSPSDSAAAHGIAPTEVCNWRERRLCGEVHDENAAGLGGMAGHAGLFGQASDLCRLGNLYLNGGEGLLSREFVEESICAQIETEQGDRRGLGWLLRSEPNPSCSHQFSPQSFGHTGYTGTSLWCDPTRDLVVTLLTNRVYYGRSAKAIASFRPLVHETVVSCLGN